MNGKYTEISGHVECTQHKVYRKTSIEAEEIINGRLLRRHLETYEQWPLNGY